MRQNDFGIQLNLLETRNYGLRDVNFSAFTLYRGGTENTRLENARRSKMVGKRGTGKRGIKLQDRKTRGKACMESQMMYFT